MAITLRPAVRVILKAGLTAGTIDIGAACLINWLSPPAILKAIASGVLGQASFRMGLPAAILGLALQWGMSCLIAAIYVVGAGQCKLQRRWWIAAGLAYGLVIFVVMNYVVMPLSAVGHRPTFSAARLAGNLLAMSLFGLIIAYFDSRGAKDRLARPN